jgi:uncharacterized protein YdhG (YjbR/CyaY superfamily)
MKRSRRQVKKTAFPEGLAQSAQRALANAGIDHLEQLAKVPEAEVQNLHGIGPNALRKLRDALTAHGLSFADSAQAASADNMPKGRKSTDIDNYISQFPADLQTILEEVRKTIRQAAPDATEVISYQMPAFKQHGILVYFAAWKKHIGLYPPISGDEALERELSRYAGPKGNLQFPLDEPVPYDLIERIVKLRVEQDAAKAAARRKKRK